MNLDREQRNIVILMASVLGTALAVAIIILLLVGGSSGGGPGVPYNLNSSDQASIGKTAQLIVREAGSFGYVSSEINPSNAQSISTSNSKYFRSLSSAYDSASSLFAPHSPLLGFTSAYSQADGLLSQTHFATVEAGGATTTFGKRGYTLQGHTYVVAHVAFDSTQILRSVNDGIGAGGTFNVSKYLIPVSFSGLFEKTAHGWRLFRVESIENFSALALPWSGLGSQVYAWPSDPNLAPLKSYTTKAPPLTPAVKALLKQQQQTSTNPAPSPIVKTPPIN